MAVNLRPSDLNFKGPQSYAHLRGITLIPLLALDDILPLIIALLRRAFMVRNFLTYYNDTALLMSTHRLRR